MERRARNEALSAGFTLAEMLVALTLVGLIFVMVFGGLHFGTQSWDRVHDVSRERDRVIAAQMFLRSRLSTSGISNPITMPGDREGSGPRGERDRLEFSAPWLSYLSVGGVYTFALHLDDAGDEGQLILSWRPAEDDLAGEDVDEIAGERVLLNGVDAFAVNYFGTVEQDGQRSWRPEWPEDAAPPELVRIDIDFMDPGRVWPTLVIRPGR